ncbi:type IX secretion system membrane protein, PorP/SprF family [Flavobacterium sp. CF108]|uniref:PorP/SprF family type IX secretion system membrane protein n=1 Tax=unclassified Flavobacterium TaxID=196869 RepID=UPI0008D295B4|nr:MULTISPECIES: type IX secretion system membrane protein PorP/SprF [unclassified Flavobacterium]SEO62620.1 type IX secretion system membrane protein, PorP/SprF family [Flavobacterium sp. fv08]SHI07154.1 type IX secretion system membrane protein, PorP/SprF family [Flavobacterium sp. CF108]
MKNIYHIVIILLAGVFSASAQQESQYSQYMYNTMTFNPGYTGSREVISALGLYRTQWVGLEGAPKTMNFSIQSPLGTHANGIGLNVVSDQIGPVKNTGAMASFAYTILGSTDVKYSFGVSGGFDNFSVDYNKVNRERMDDPYMVGTVSQFSPNVGAGFYVHADSWYVGISSPKLLKTSYYDDVKETTYSTKSHFYLLGGYVFDLNPYLKFKPAVLTKYVSGAPLAVDVSANFMFNDKFTLGAAYRWDAAVSALAGFQITDGLMVGYGYDHDTTKLGNYNSGSHEIFLRFELTGSSKSRLVTPRFF